MSRKHLHRYVQEFTTKHHIKALSSMDNMAYLASIMANKRLLYRELVAYNHDFILIRSNTTFTSSIHFFLMKSTKHKPIDAPYVQTKKVQMPPSSYRPSKKELEMPFENPG